MFWQRTRDIPESQAKQTASSETEYLISKEEKQNCPVSSFYLRRGHPWASLGWRFQCPREVISGTGGQIISKGEVLSWGDGISSGELLGQGNAVWDMGLGISLLSGHPLRLVWILAFATLG